MKKPITLLLLAGLLTALGSCGDTSSGAATDTKPDHTTDPAVTETADPYAREREIFNALPAVDFGGQTQTFAVQDGINRADTEIYVEEADGDVINDAVYKRNLKISERFNCSLAVQKGDVNSLVQQSVNAADAAFAAAMPNIEIAGILAQGGYLLNYLDYDDILHLNEPWWDSGTAALKMSGKVFFMSGDINMLDNDVTYIMLFNKKLISDNDMEEPYGLVRDGKWTLDTFGKLCADISADINGDGNFDEKDRYGYCTTPAGPGAMFFSCDLHYVAFDDAGVPYLDVDVDKISATLEKVVDIIGSNNTAFIPADYNVGKQVFLEDRALFYGEVLSYIINLRDMESEFGVLPLPKYDEAQKNYITYCNNISSTAVMPNNGCDTRGCDAA